MSFDSEDYIPKRFGLKFFPPVIVLEYLVPSSGKLYHHRIKIKDLEQEIETLVETTKKRHFRYINHPKIEDSQLVNLIKCLKEKHTQDLNKLTPEEVLKIKSQMEHQFRANQINPENPEFVYDKRKQFQPTEICEWDESEDLIL